MPARVHSAKDPLPPLLAIDTSFLVSVLNAAEPAHRAAFVLYRRLVAEGTLVAYCRPIILLEFWAAWRRVVNKLDQAEVDQLIREARSRLTGQQELPLPMRGKLDGKARRRYLFNEGEGLLHRELAALRTVPVRFTERLVRAARKEIIEWGLNSRDATILAVARLTANQAGLDSHLVAVDSDFLRVEDLHLWHIK